MRSSCQSRAYRPPIHPIRKPGGLYRSKRKPELRRLPRHLTCRRRKSPRDASSRPCSAPSDFIMHKRGAISIDRCVAKPKRLPHAAVSPLTRRCPGALMSARVSRARGTSRQSGCDLRDLQFSTKLSAGNCEAATLHRSDAREVACTSPEVDRARPRNGPPASSRESLPARKAHWCMVGKEDRSSPGTHSQARSDEPQDCRYRRSRHVSRVQGPQIARVTPIVEMTAESCSRRFAGRQRRLHPFGEVEGTPTSQSRAR